MATQGAYLVPRSHTPVFEEAYHETFTAALDRAFKLFEFGQRLRRSKYHEAADEWPMGHTPHEVKERRLAELRVLDEMWDVTSDEGSDRDEGDDATPDGKVRVVEKVQPTVERASRTRSQEAHELPTPPLSAQSPLLTPQGRKRRRDNEEEYQRKARAISAARLDVPEGDKPDGSQMKDRKRRRTDDVDNEGKGDGESLVKA